MQPAVGDITYVDEAMVMDASSLQTQLKAVLESHTAELEARISGIVCDSEARLRAQAAADAGALRESFGRLLPAAAPAQHQRDVEAELEKDSAKDTVASGDVPVLVDEEAGRETRRIVEECVDKLWKVQARSLNKVKSTRPGSLTNTPSKLVEEMPRKLTDEIEMLSQAGAAAASIPGVVSVTSEFSVVPGPSPDDDGSALAHVMQRGRLVSDFTPKKEPKGRVSQQALVKDLEAFTLIKTQSNTIKRAHSNVYNDDRESPHTLVEKASAIVEVVSTLVLVANVIWMTVATELSMRHVRKGEEAPEYFFWIDLFFVIAMCIEVATKLFLFRADFFIGPGHRWNVFDVVLIILAGVDLLLSAANLSFVRVLRGLRAIRATRVIRTAAVVPELRLMFASVIASAASLFWAFVLILLVLLLCALGVQQTVHSALETGGVASQHPHLMEYYGSLPTTVLSLFMAISGGTDWKRLAEPLVHISPFYIVAYVLFIILMIFGLLNILTAVFVEKTSDVSQIDPALVIEEKLAEEKSSISQLLQVLGEADRGATGRISKDAFEAKLVDPRFRAQMHLLDLDILDVQGIFRLLDSEESGQIEIEELVYGLMLMKGNARSMDMHTILYDTTRLLNRLVAFQHAVEGSLCDIQGTLSAQHKKPFLRSF